MKSILILLLFILILLLSPIFPQQEKIVEEVTVEWWVVPVFALDRSGQPVLDLEKTDIELKVDNKKIDAFTLIKKSFTVSERPARQEKEKAAVPPAPERKKNVFLVFDTALSGRGSTEAAKAIARAIITTAEKNTRFFIMTIEPFAGLLYAGGQTSDKNRLLEIITKRVKGKRNSRIPDPDEVAIQMTGRGQLKYGPGDVPFLTASISKYFKRKSMNFVQAFESLYYALNSIKDNKFIYLFTEGISTAIQEADKGDRSMYREYLEQAAGYLGRSGSVLFIINPSGGAAVDLSETSGKDSLTFLAQKSRGKYLDGSDKNLMAKIENLHQAYYEIAFPAVPESKSGILKISLQPQRRGIDIHTLHTAEKARQYSQMKTMEQEVLALNLISGNPLYESEAASEKVQIKKISKKKKKITYYVKIPDRFLGRTLDLYKVWTAKKSADGSEETYGTDTRMEKETLRIKRRKKKITFHNLKPGDETYFVLVDGQQKSALVHGMKKEKQETFAFNIPQDPEEWVSKEIIEKQKQEEKPGQNPELKKLLKGAAKYCEKLKKAAFHYLCKEKIVETQKPLTYRENLERDVAVNPGHPLFTRASGRVQRQVINAVQIKKHLVNYRLIKTGDRVKEEREKITEKPGETGSPTTETAEPTENTETTETANLEDIRFISSKAVFGPLTLLAPDRQNHYHFQLLGYQELKNRPTAILEVYPKSEKDSHYIYGKLWIDTEDFSVLKIKANPNSIRGYDRLKKLADELNTRLILNLETEFFKIRSGIRFPTQIHFEENYKGGSFISKYRGSREWTRTNTMTTYSDYLFFKVDMDIKYDR